MIDHLQTAKDLMAQPPAPTPKLYVVVVRSSHALGWVDRYGNAAPTTEEAWKGDEGTAREIARLLGEAGPGAYHVARLADHDDVEAMGE